MPRTNGVSVYMSDDMEQELKQRARDSDKTLSAYINDLLRRELQREAEDDVASEVRAEERIRELIGIATDEMQQATEEMRDMNAKAGAYAAANFELLKQSHKDAERRDTLSTGSRRLRQDLDAVVDDLGGGSHEPTQRRESDATDDDDPGDPFAHREND